MTSPAPLVSVVMPNFNKGQFISQAIDSVQTQTFRDFELIVVDDCSTDSSVETAQAYLGHGQPVRLVRQGRHLGTSAARNMGIRESRANHIALLDSDDVYSPLWLEHGLRSLAAVEAPSIVYSDWWVMGSDGRRLRGARPHTTRSGMLFPDLLLQSLEVNTALIAPRWCLLDAGLYDESVAWGEDYDLVLRLAAKYPFIYLDEEAYGYRLYRGNSWKQFSREKMYEHKAAILERHLKQGRGLLDEEQASAVHRKLLYYVSRSGRRKRLARTLAAP